MRSVQILGAFGSAVSAYTWASVNTGGGGGFVPGIVFNPGEQGIAYARTDIGGAYRLNSDDSWTPLTDFANDTTWHDWGVNAIAADPVDTSNVYILVGMYTNDWDPNDGSVLRSSDYGSTWSETKLPFKIGGNLPGRGVGERLAIDPQNNDIIYLAAPSGNGLYKSTDAGVTFSQVSSFTDHGTYADDPTDTTGYSSDLIGLTTVVFDTTSGTTSGATSRIFVGVANTNSTSLYVSEDAGSTWTAVADQPSGRFPRRIKFSESEDALYLAYDNVAGPYAAGDGKVYRYAIDNSTWTDITPAWEASFGVTFGYGGIAIDAQNPGTIVVAADNLWWPDVQIFRSTDYGASWETLWEYDGSVEAYYTMDTSNAPWITALRGTDSKVLGWMVEALEIDPFDSDHWLYGTGESLFGGHDLTDWPDVAISSLAVGIEEMSVQGIISPPGGPPLLSAVGDDCGFVHESLTVAPTTPFTNPVWSTTDDIDYAGNSPTDIVRIGNSGSDGVSQIATSSDSGSTWAPLNVTSTSIYGGHVAYSADGTSIVWVSATEGVFHYSDGTWTTVSTLSQGSTVNVIAADKVNDNYFYSADSSAIYVSSDGGATFTKTATSSGTQSHIEVHPSVAGDVWLSTSSGLFHSTDFGSTWSQISGISVAYAIALGAGSGSYPNVYGFITGSSGYNVLSVSTDEGATWTEIADSTHGFGASSANCLTASQDTEGLVFVGTNGRGTFYGLPSGSTGTTTTTSRVSSTTSTKASTSTTSTKASTTTTSTKATTTSSSTTLVTSTTSTTTSAAATTTTIPQYGQCGGTGWTGTGTCVSGTTCTYQNDYYSQCL